ncbi:uncharacterized protein TNCV_1169011 [Trichonephila clavipes]|uniref:Uncharacterized protein n=1 Tax=Trichonephila clavipes TaxID=2585209 RepID=A0A8X6VK53_TRICX|nr:uncharacterized protein TNCV_1169011 [Trichonephila clavipes]
MLVHVKSVEAQSPPVDIVWKSEEDVSCSGVGILNRGHVIQEVMVTDSSPGTTEDPPCRADRSTLHLSNSLPLVWCHEPTITGSAYPDAPQLWLFPQLKESVPDNFIWQRDGAPPHWYLSIRDCLNITVLDQWILRKGPHDTACFAWPPRSPDLTPCDFYLWGFVKDCVYVPPLPNDLPGLRYKIEAAVARITSEILNKV